MSGKIINIENTINADVQRVWDLYHQPEAIMQWNTASPDWHCPSSEIDLRPEGRFKHTMAAKDGSFSFDFSGKFLEVIPFRKVSYVLDDSRNVDVNFSTQQGVTKVGISFEAEETNPIDMQQQGWQAILDNFKNYVEQIA